MKIAFVGDVHGKFSMFCDLVNKLDCDMVIQCGDYGIWIDCTDILPKSYKYDFNKPVIFIEGNHDNHKFLNLQEKSNLPVMLSNNMYWMPRGYKYNIGGKKFFFCGGADSIDKEYRLKYYPMTWWAEERIDLSLLDTVTKDEYFDFIVTHDRPSFISRKLGFNVPSDPLSSSFVLERLFYKINCKYWIHGHWHMNDIYKCGDSTFIGLDMLRNSIDDEELEIFWKETKLGLGTDYYIIMDV